MVDMASLEGRNRAQFLIPKRAHTDCGSFPCGVVVRPFAPNFNALFILYRRVSLLLGRWDELELCLISGFGAAPDEDFGLPGFEPLDTVGAGKRK